MSILNLPPRLPDGLLGVVTDGKFLHVGCHASVEAVEQLLENEDDNIPVFKSDDWRHEVGLCTKCGHGVDDGGY